MYKKKIAVRAMTAIAAGALLVSNVSVAVASTNSTAVVAEEKDASKADERVAKAIVEFQDSDTDEIVKTITLTHKATAEEADLESYLFIPGEGDFVAPKGYELDGSNAVEAFYGQEPTKSSCYVKAIDKPVEKKVAKLNVEFIDAEENVVATKTLTHEATAEEADAEYYTFVTGEGDFVAPTVDGVKYELDESKSYDAYYGQAAATVQIYVKAEEKPTEKKVAKLNVEFIDAEGNVVATKTLTHEATAEEADAEYYTFVTGEGDFVAPTVDGVKYELDESKSYDAYYGQAAATVQIYVKTAEATTRTIKIQFVDADTKENIGEAKDFTVDKDAKNVNYNKIADLVPEGYTLTLSGDFFVEDVVEVEVHKNKDVETKKETVEFVDANDNAVGIPAEEVEV